MPRLKPEDLPRSFDLIRGASPTEMILRGHLWIEAAVTELVEQSMEEPSAFSTESTDTGRVALHRALRIRRRQTPPILGALAPHPADLTPSRHPAHSRSANNNPALWVGAGPIVPPVRHYSEPDGIDSRY